MFPANLDDEAPPEGALVILAEGEVVAAAQTLAVFRHEHAAIEAIFLLRAVPVLDRPLVCVQVLPLLLRPVALVPIAQGSGHLGLLVRAPGRVEVH